MIIPVQKPEENAAFIVRGAAARKGLKEACFAVIPEGGQLRGSGHVEQDQVVDAEVLEGAQTLQVFMEFQ